MPSPFPGMDPFLEGPEWEDFHATFNTVIREHLSPRVEPRYLVRIERRIYVEHTRTTALRSAGRTWPSSWRKKRRKPMSRPFPAAWSPWLPVACILPMAEEMRETYLVIRLQDSQEVVTVLETLSPGNKRPGSDGRCEYLRKREAVLESRTHLVELDLFAAASGCPPRRGCRQQPTITPLSAAVTNVPAPISTPGRSAIPCRHSPSR